VHPDRRAIRSLADEVDRLHDESMRALRNDASSQPTGHEQPVLLDIGQDSRRSFLKKVGIGSAALTVGGTVLPIGRFIPAAGAQEDDEDDSSGDEPDAEAGREAVTFVQTFELAAVVAYGLAADRLAQFGDTEARELAEQFGEHHTQYADALGTNVLVLTDEQKTEIVADDRLLADFEPALNRAGDARGVAQALKDLEDRAAATYFELLDVLTDPADAKAVALILPVTAQRAVVWSTTLDLDPAEYLLTFQAESDAASFAPTSS
jgi:hypothetical protein